MTDPTHDERAKLMAAFSHPCLSPTSHAALDSYSAEFAVLGQKGQNPQASRVSVPKSEDTQTLLTLALQDHFLFAQLHPTDLAACVDVMGALDCSSGEDVIVQGEQGSRFFVLEAGEAEVRDWLKSWE